MRIFSKLTKFEKRFVIPLMLGFFVWGGVFVFKTTNKEISTETLEFGKSVTYRIYGLTGNYAGFTGFLVNNSPLTLATCAHGMDLVDKDIGRIVVFARNEHGFGLDYVPFVLAGFSNEKDVAVFVADYFADVPFASLDNSFRLDKVFTVDAVDVAFKTQQGYLVGRRFNKKDIFQASFQVRFGQSGSPVFNADGKVIGLVKNKLYVPKNPLKIFSKEYNNSYNEDGHISVFTGIVPARTISNLLVETQK